MAKANPTPNQASAKYFKHYDALRRTDGTNKRILKDKEGEICLLPKRETETRTRQPWLNPKTKS
jgi:hypothetical protein